VEGSRFFFGVFVVMSAVEQVTEQRPAGRPDEPFAAGFKQGERRPLEVFAA
jgi:hypothetical protein